MTYTRFIQVALNMCFRIMMASIIQPSLQRDRDPWHEICGLIDAFNDDNTPRV
jgi:hypothetical protein